MIGHFGLTSREVVYSYPQNSGGGSWASGGGYGMATTSYKTPPRPSLWCVHLVEHVDIPALYSMEWTDVIGIHGFKVAQGLAEAAERFAEHGSFKWLFILPLVKKFDAINPKLTTAAARKSGKKGFADEDDSFLSVASRICSLAKDLRDQEEAEKVAASIASEVSVPNIQDSAATVGGGASAASEVKSTSLVIFDDDFSDPVSGVAGMFDRAVSKRTKLARAWFAMCIRHSPGLPELKDLVTTFMVHNAEQIMKPMCAKISSLGTLDDEDFSTLSALLECMPELQTPDILTAVLQVPSLASRTAVLVDFATLCVKRYSFQSQQASEKSETSSDLILISDAEFISGKWFQLSTAAKEWFRSRHSVEPFRAHAGADDDDADEGWWSAWGGGKKKKAVKKVVVDQVAVSRDALSSALGDLSTFFKAVIFSKCSQGLMFEFRRCWFLNGPNERVFEVLVKVRIAVFDFF